MAPASIVRTPRGGEFEGIEIEGFKIGVPTPKGTSYSLVQRLLLQAVYSLATKHSVTDDRRTTVPWP